MPSSENSGDQLEAFNGESVTTKRMWVLDWAPRAGDVLLCVWPLSHRLVRCWFDLCLSSKYSLQAEFTRFICDFKYTFTLG